MPTLSTHVLDVAAGQPAPGVEVTLLPVTGGGHGSEAVQAHTDADGRIVGPLGGVLAIGLWRLAFALGPYYEERQRPGCMVVFEITLLLSEERHYHVPLLATPNSATSYLGT